MSFPRKIVISAGYGTGIASCHISLSNDRNGYDLAEDPTLIECVQQGIKDEEVVLSKLFESGRWSPEDNLCLLGLRDAVVTEVNRPYRILDYDGFETIEYPEEISWRF